RTVPLERKAVLVVFVAGLGVAWCRGLRRTAVVVETAMLVPRHDEHTALPSRGVADRLVRRLDESLTLSDVRQRMLRAAGPVIVQDVVARFDQDVAIRIGRLGKIPSEQAVVPYVVEVDSFERGHHREVVAT